LEQVPGLSVTPVVARRITTLKPPHPGHQIRLRRLQQPMVLVTHQDVGMHFPASAPADLSQSLKKTSPIQIIFKDVFTPISPTHHVVSGPLKLHPYFASHLRLYSLPAQDKRKKD
jgi:hypothetical protein